MHDGTTKILSLDLSKNANIQQELASQVLKQQSGETESDIKQEENPFRDDSVSDLKIPSDNIDKEIN